MTKIKVLINSQEIDVLKLEEGNEYIIGRGKEADLQIRDKTFSRKHLRIFFDETWQIECLSKYIEMETNDGSAKRLDLSQVREFRVQKYLFQFLEEKLDEENDPIDFEIQENKELMEEDLSGNSKEQASNELIEDEDTNVEAIQASPFILMSKDGNLIKKQKLEGQEWTIGRSVKCDIYIEDSKASRKHCQISKSQDQYFISDFGSSNGTYLNNKRMKANKVAPLNSGDSIRIGRLILVFELINEELEKEINQLPSLLNQEIQPYGKSLQKNPNPLGIRSQAGNLENPGAVRMYRPSQEEKKKKQLLKFGAIAILLVSLFFFLNSPSNKEERRELTSKDTVKSKFDNLSNENQELVLRFYDLAYRYYIQGEYQKALNETKKIHRLLPETGYLDLSVEKDSKELEKMTKTAIELERQKKAVQRQKAEQRKLREEVARMVEKCDKQAVPGTSVEQAKQCLRSVYELDPDNKRARAIIERLEYQAEQRSIQQAQKASYNQRVQKGRNLYQKAQKLEKRNKILDAISAYKRHIASNYPDPSSLKKESQEKTKKLALELNKRIESLIKQAEADYESKNYKSAIQNLNETLDLDPSVQKAKDLLAKVSRDLNGELKTLYSDSVLEESLGNIETSKSLWKKIIEKDVPSGDYYQKARRKLKKYGD